MVDFLKFWAMWAVIVVVALLLVFAAAQLVLQFGFAWAVIVVMVAGWIWARNFDVGRYGERAWLVPIVFIVVAIGLAVGLLARMAPS